MSDKGKLPDCFLCGLVDKSNTTCQHCLLEKQKVIGMCSQHRRLHERPSFDAKNNYGSCYPYEIATDIHKGR